MAPHAPGEVLVFTATRKSCDALCAALAAAFPKRTVEVYHAGLGDAEREDAQARFLRREIGVLVCTMASFGTGVDMPGVRQVVLDGLPMSMHLLVQLIGRGGRDGGPWRVDIFAAPQDKAKSRALLAREVQDMKVPHAAFMLDAYAMVEVFSRGQTCLYQVRIPHQLFARCARTGSLFVGHKKTLSDNTTLRHKTTKQGSAFTFLVT